MQTINIPILPGYQLTEIREGDQASYLKFIGDKDIYRFTLAIPHPYTRKDADWWIQHVSQTTSKNGRVVQFAIRDQKTLEVIGGIGFDSLTVGKDHRAEVGYWLAKPFWGRGIMTAALKAVCIYAFNNFEVIRITANIFEENVGSQRVAEKAGFKLEGKLRKHYKKDGHLKDGRLYALLKEDLS